MFSKPRDACVRYLHLASLRLAVAFGYTLIYIRIVMAHMERITDSRIPDTLPPLMDGYARQFKIDDDDKFLGYIDRKYNGEHVWIDDILEQCRAVAEAGNPPDYVTKIIALLSEGS